MTSLVSTCEMLTGVHLFVGSLRSIISKVLNPGQSLAWLVTFVCHNDDTATVTAKATGF